MPIQFFSEDTSFQYSNPIAEEWLKSVIHQHDHSLGTLNFIFCSDDYLLQINQDYLEHDYYTDIITFPMNDMPKEVAGDLYLSVDRIEENAREYEVTFENELHRVMIHGVLHLLGFDDKSEEHQARIREEENKSLRLLNAMKQS